MKTRSLIFVALFAFASLALNGCNTKRAFHTTLDESSVSTRPALSIPPNFDLTAPQTTTDTIQEKKTVTKPSDDLKRPAVASPATAKAGNLTASDQSFMNKIRKDKPLTN